ncbi:hypothetical protein [Teichococcus vastitatis]|uniref:Uncharacterized protein n=1 Tax=Teichococcus vastitatis TaxID=2307076 RepID=A0ABS9W6F7_9PROT|nr:hypothetical protein [Pseudoroseomonas vastitatis]MCI0754874.1 hypothetical protein [Pseudoroseomonas vastitatis]
MLQFLLYLPPHHASVSILEAKMALLPANYAGVLQGIDQSMLNGVSTLTDLRKMTSAAFLKISSVEGVTVRIEAPLAEGGDLPASVLRGLVIRCLLPKGIELEALRASLTDGAASRLIQIILAGHQVTFAPEGGHGWLTRGALQARAQLLTLLSQLPEAKPEALPAPVASVSCAPPTLQAA